MFASKATSPRISLKITFKDDIPTGGLLFTFNSSSAAADRQTVQDILIPYITANRAGAAPGAGTATPTAAGPSTPTSMGTPGTPGPSSVVNKGKRKAEDDAGGAAGAAKLKAMNRLRLRVLNKTPNLKLLHRELVVGKQITEEEFWEGREVSYLTWRHASGYSSLGAEYRLCSKRRRWHTPKGQDGLRACSTTDSILTLGRRRRQVSVGQEWESSPRRIVVPWCSICQRN